MGMAEWLTLDGWVYQPGVGGGGLDEWRSYVDNRGR